MLSSLKKLLSESTEEVFQVIVFRCYLFLVAFIYGLGAIIEILIDFKSITLQIFLALVVIPVILLVLSFIGVRHKLLLVLNLLLSVAINQVQLSLNPLSFHVLIYWIGLMPLVAMVLTQSGRDTFIWTIFFLAVILFNGLYILKSVGTYTITIYPERFIAAGFLFAFLTSSLAAFFNYTQGKSRTKLKNQNQMLLQLKHEVEKQNIQLKQQHETLDLKNDRLEKYIETILTLSQSKEVIEGNFEESVEITCANLREIMNVSRVGYWRYNEISDTTTYQYIFPEEFFDPIAFSLKSFPKYAAQVKEQSIIALANVYADASIQEIADIYLIPNNIKSLLISPLVISRQLVGGIFCENISDERSWDAEDILLVSAACDILTIAHEADLNKQYIQEIEMKNNTLEEQSHKIKQFNEELRTINENLEERVKERTKELEEQNHHLAEYAFINSHLLRAPLSSILGLINLLASSELSEKESELVKHLYDSGIKLDDVIRRISTILEKGGQLNRYHLYKKSNE